MSDAPATMPPGSVPLAALHATLVEDLTPVRRVGAPIGRAVLWIAAVAALGAGLACVADLDSVRQRLMAVPDMWLAVCGSTLTAICAAVAAFELSLPDRSRSWVLLPMPALALWISASGLGCARTWLIPGTHEASWAETRICLGFIVGLSVPLSILMFVMLRRGYSLLPTLAGAMGGLAVGSAAATLLNFFHPYDAALDDLLVHTAAVVIVVVANRFAGSWLLGARPKLAAR